MEYQKNIDENLVKCLESNHDIQKNIDNGRDDIRKSRYRDFLMNF